MIEGIVIALKIIWAVIAFFGEKNAERKKKRKDALKEIFDGVDEKDPTRITAGFDRLNRL
jgi:hypothetical protein